MLYLHIVHGFTLKAGGGMSLKWSIIEMLEFEEYGAVSHRADFCIPLRFCCFSMDRCVVFFCSISCMTFLKMQMLMLKEKRVFRTCIFTFYCLMSHVFKHKNAFSKNFLLNSSYIRHNPTRFLYGLWRKCLMYENNKSGKEGLNTEGHKMCVC